MVIYKYQLEKRINHLEIQGKMIRPLYIAMQNGVPTFWGLIDNKSQTKTTWHYAIIATGEEVPEYFKESEYVTTFFSGELVWHLFMTAV